MNDWIQCMGCLIWFDWFIAHRVRPCSSAVGILFQWRRYRSGTTSRARCASTARSHRSSICRTCAPTAAKRCLLRRWSANHRAIVIQRYSAVPTHHNNSPNWIIFIPFCRSQKIKIPVFFLFLCKLYLTYVNVC